MKAKVKTWLRNVENGTLKTNTEIVLNKIKDSTPDADGFIFENYGKGISTYHLRESLNMSHQTLTSRLSQLQDEGLIKDVSQVIVNDTYYSVYMFVSDIQYRERLIHLRKHENYVKWLKNADKYIEFMDRNTVQAVAYEQEIIGL